MSSIEIPQLQFEAHCPEDVWDLLDLNGAGDLWLAGELDTGTYEDILENLGEIRDPESFLRSVECSYLPL